MARFTVIVPEPVGEAVLTLADREWRRPGDQAGYLIAEALRARGVLPAEPADRCELVPAGGHDAA